MADTSSNVLVKLFEVRVQRSDDIAAMEAEAEARHQHQLEAAVARHPGEEDESIVDPSAALSRMRETAQSAPPRAPLSTAPKVGRCETGIRKAVTKQTVREAMAIYYEECAELYTEAGCRDAFHAAAHAEPADQLAIVVRGCRGSYCPLLGASRYEACSDRFQI